MVSWVAKEITVKILKGHCHEDFAIFGKFCAKIITKCLYLYTNKTVYKMREKGNKKKGERKIKKKSSGVLFFSFKSHLKG